MAWSRLRYADVLLPHRTPLLQPRSAARRYAFAAGAFLLGLAARMLAARALGQTVPYITFFPAVILSAWFGGFGPGMLTTLLSVAGAVFVILPPAYSLRIETLPDATAAVLFIVVCTFISRMQDALRHSMADSQDSLALLLSSEAARERQRQWYEQTLASIGDGVIATNTEARIQFVNAVAAKLMSGVQSELINRPIAEVFRIVDEQTRAPLEDPIGRVLREGQAVTLAERTILVAANGTEIPIGDSAAPIKDRSGKVLGAVLVFRDMSDRRNAEQALRDSEETFRLATESAHMGSWRNELVARRVIWSPELERIFGLQPGEFTGTQEEFYSYIHADDKGSVETEIATAIRDRREYEIEFRFHRKGDSSFRWMLTRARPYYDATGNPVTLAGISLDVTERKTADDALRSLNRNLEATNDDLRQFAYAASHDLQEPLRMVVSYTQLLQQRYKDKIDAQANTFIDYAVEGALRLEHLLRGLLEYYRAGEIGDRPREAVDCNRAVQTALSNLAASIQETAAVVRCDSLPTCQAHEIPMVQLFQNLIGNALKYHGNKSPSIHIGARRDGSAWEFAISDEGIGIDARYTRQIFGVFKRLHGHDLPGTGIGLAICSRIVERYGGLIWVESELGQGSTFRFTIPDGR